MADDHRIAAVRSPTPARRLVPSRLRSVSDDELVARVRRGDASAFEAVYDRYHLALLGFCRHMLGSRQEAEDALQHVFIAAHRTLQEDARPLQLKPWLYAVARNRCTSVLRARRDEAGFEDTIAPGATDGLALAEEVERRADLRALLSDVAALPEEQRAALVLSELGDLTHEEIGVTLGVRKEKVKALVFQARESLLGSKHARDVDCSEIREQLGTLRGGALRRTPIARHVAGCPGCAAYKEDVRRQRAALGMVLPVVPALALKEQVLTAALGAAGTGAAGAAGAAGLGAAGGGAGAAAAGGAAVGGAAKVLAVVAITGSAVGGGIALRGDPAPAARSAKPLPTQQVAAVRARGPARKPTGYLSPSIPRRAPSPTSTPATPAAVQRLLAGGDDDPRGTAGTAKRPGAKGSVRPASTGRKPAGGTTAVASASAPAGPTARAGNEDAGSGAQAAGAGTTGREDAKAAERARRKAMKAEAKARREAAKAAAKARRDAAKVARAQRKRAAAAAREAAKGRKAAKARKAAKDRKAAEDREAAKARKAAGDREAARERRRAAKAQPSAGATAGARKGRSTPTTTKPAKDGGKRGGLEGPAARSPGRRQGAWLRPAAGFGARSRRTPQPHARPARWRRMYPVRTSLVLADDSPVYRSGLLRSILQETRLELLSVVEDGDAALEAIANLRPDVALLDVRMPGRSGLEVCEALAVDGAIPRTRVVLMSAHADAQLATQARQAGVATVLSKALPRRDILDAVLVAASLPSVRCA